MKCIFDVIKKKRKFIGREKELLAMEQLLTAKKEDWGIIHFYGPAGMGKTVLLQQFALIHKHLPVIYIDGHNGFRSAHDFLTAVHKQLVDKHMLTAESLELNVIEELKRIISKHAVFVLLLDGMDQCHGILDWLKDEFLKILPINVRIYSAGRLPLDDWQTDYGWETIVKNIKINPFSKTEWTQYANACGITDARQLYQIGFISQGIPLAVSLICNWIVEYGNLERLSEAYGRHFMALFDKYLLNEQSLDGVNSTLLALASLTYTFDQEMLEHMLGRSVSSVAFSQLCQSSFVEAHANGGWMVKNGIRWWVRARIKRRFPEAYAQYKQRAEEVLERRIVTSNKDQIARKLELAIGKIFLQDTEFTRSLVYFGDQQNLTIRAATEEDLPLLAKMYQHNIQISPPYLNDDSHQEQYLYEIWKIDPSAIQMIEYDNQCLFFFVLVSLSEEMRAVFKNNPLTEKWINETSLEEQDLFYWLISTNQPTDWEVISFFLHHIFLPTLSDRRVTCLLLLKDQAKFLKLIGFEHLSFADYRTNSGLQFSLYCLDSRETLKKTNLSFESFLVQEKDELAIWINLTKKILSGYPALERQATLLEQYKQLLASDLAYDELAKRIRRIIDDQLQRLKEGTKQEKTQARILQHAYLKKRGSHETVAALLDIPTSTYYRQLKKLVHSIAFILQTQIE